MEENQSVILVNCFDAMAFWREIFSNFRGNLEDFKNMQRFLKEGSNGVL